MYVYTCNLYSNIICRIENVFNVVVFYVYCSHYLLIAVPVVRPKDSSVTAPFTPVVPRNEILLKSLRTQTVDVVQQPIPFLVSSIHPNDIPTTINFGYKWRHAFKANHYYSVVLVVFTKTNVSVDRCEFRCPECRQV